MKTCTKCNQQKELLEFYKSKRTKDGIQVWCKECMKFISRENSRKYRAKQALKRKFNRDDFNKKWEEIKWN